MAALDELRRIYVPHPEHGARCKWCDERMRRVAQILAAYRAYVLREAAAKIRNADINPQDIGSAWDGMIDAADLIDPDVEA